MSVHHLAQEQFLAGCQHSESTVQVDRVSGANYVLMCLRIGCRRGRRHRRREPDDSTPTDRTDSGDELEAQDPGALNVVGWAVVVPLLVSSLRAAAPGLRRWPGSTLARPAGAAPARGRRPADAPGSRRRRPAGRRRRSHPDGVRIMPGPDGEPAPRSPAPRRRSAAPAATRRATATRPRPASAAPTSPGGGVIVTTPAALRPPRPTRRPARPARPAPRRRPGARPSAPELPAPPANGDAEPASTAGAARPGPRARPPPSTGGAGP